MSAKDVVVRAKEYLDKKSWDEASGLIFDEIQTLVDQHDWQQLEFFSAALLKEILTQENVEKVIFHASALEVFRRQMEDLIVRSIDEAGKKPDVKALYFEFYYDGSNDPESCTGNIFLCTSYSSDCDEWASEFEDFVEGMDISEYFSYDPDLEFSPSESVAASYYAAICLLKICADIYFSSPCKYPFGFASHDWDKMIRLTR